MYDYVIVGQGIAGSMLSWFLMQANQKVLVIDKHNTSSSSNIASGMTNPITGRRFVKTWLADAIIPFAEKTYRGLEELLVEEFYHPVTIFKLFDSIKTQNDWSARCASAGYTAYLKNENIVYVDKQKVKNDFGGFEINGGSRLQTDKFLSLFKNLLRKKDAFLEEEFSFDDLNVHGNNVSYKDIRARKIIFCEGAYAIHNPYFKFLPFQLAKGECLILRIENFYTDKVIIGEAGIVPLCEKDLYYIGATHAWHYSDDRPSEIGRNEILGNLSTVLSTPFEIVDQKAAIRPTVKDRRPFVGFHPEFNNVGIFNGMGTKGISLAPFFANHFTEHLLKQIPLMKEVDIKRFL